MLEKLNIADVLFLDIETVPEKANYADLSDDFKYLWKLKSKFILKKYDEEVTEEDAIACYDRAGIYAEFGKIIAISVGFVVKDPETQKMGIRLKSFANRDESVLLNEFVGLVNKHYTSPSKHYFCGHNIREFDIPYICRRLLVNQIKLPYLLDISGKKPWETKYFLDTLEMWKFGDYKNYTSLKLLAAVFGFPSPKDDIDGSDVGRVFWEDDDLERIATYCEKDVLATVQLFLKYLRQPIIEADQVVHVS